MGCSIRAAHARRHENHKLALAAPPLSPTHKGPVPAPFFFPRVSTCPPLAPCAWGGERPLGCLWGSPRMPLHAWAQPPSLPTHHGFGAGPHHPLFSSAFSPGRMPRPPSLPTPRHHPHVHHPLAHGQAGRGQPAPWWGRVHGKAPLLLPQPPPPEQKRESIIPHHPTHPTTHPPHPPPDTQRVYYHGGRDLGGA